MDMQDLVFKRQFVLRSSSLDGLMYEINYYSERGFKPYGEYRKDGNEYTQVMTNPNPAIGY